jgi:cysteine-S-conjugate beta-lyase
VSTPPTTPLTALSLDQLRQRRSLKWRQYAPDVLPLWVMEMDAPLAPPITEALMAALARGDTGYVHPGRLPEAFAGFARRHYDWTPDPARMTVVGDVLSGLEIALEMVSARGDGVVVHTPAYPPLFEHVTGAGRRIVESPLARDADGAYRFDPDRLERDLAPADVTVLLLGNPHNPTGTVFTRDELTIMADLAHAHGVRIVADEIHAPMTYPDVRHVPVAAVASPAADAALTVVSASKAFNLPGLKTALLVGAGDAAAASMAQIPHRARYGAGLLGVIASEIAYTDGDAWLAALMRDLDANRWALADLLAAALPAVRYVPPRGTYVAWLDCTALDLGDDPAAAFLERGRVALSSGPDFGAPGRGFARLNLATAPANLAEAVRRMARAVGS